MSKIVNMMYRNGRLIYRNMGYKPPQPTASTVWLPLSSITNYQAFNAIAWGTSYSPSDAGGSVGGDRWVSEVPYIESDNMGWGDGNSDETGWFATHRWNGTQYSLTFDHINYGYDNPDVEYGVSVANNQRDILGVSTIQVCGQTESVYMTEFHDWVDWKPCFGAYSGASSLYDGNVYVRVQPSDQIWYTTTDGQPTKLYFIPTPSATTWYNTYGVDGGIIEYPGQDVVDAVVGFHSSDAWDSNIKTVIFPIGTTYLVNMSNSSGLTHVELPATVTELNGSYFYNCPNFDGEFPATVTAFTHNALSNMWGNATELKHFNGRAQVYDTVSLANNNLSSVTFSSAITSVGNSFLAGNPDLRTIRIESSTFPSSWNYAGDSETPTDGTFYVPYGCDLTNFPTRNSFSTWDISYF